MLRLTISGKEAELYESDPVQVKMQFQDVQNLSGSKSNYSKTFRLPLTGPNQLIFGAVNDPTSVTALFDPKQRLEAVMYDDSLELIRGYIQVKGFVKQRKDYMDVLVTFFGETANLSRAIGDRLLTDLDLSAYDVNQTNANISATWTGSQDLRFGIVDRGQNWSGTDTFSNSANEIDPYRLTAHLRVRAIVDAIFSEAGVTYESTWLSGMDDLYLMMLNNGSIFNVTTLSIPLAGIHVGLTSNLLFTATTFTTIVYAESGSYYDQGNQYLSGTFTASEAGLYRFRVRTKFASTLSSGQYQSAAFVNGSNVQSILTLSSGALSSTLQYLQNVDVFLQPSDTFQVRHRITSGGGTVTIEGTGGLSAPTTSLELYDYQMSGLGINVSANAPVMKQIDFLSGLQKMFNLVFIPDKFVEGHYYIEPYADYVATGARLDWSNKINYDKDVEILPTSDLQAREYLWTLEAGQDFLGKTIQDTLQRAYGEFKVRDAANDFAVGVKEVKAPFATYTTSLIPDTDFPILRLLDQAGESVGEPLPRLAFWNGTRNISFVMGGTTYTTFPVFSDQSDFDTDLFGTTEDLNFGYERKFRSILGNPRDTLYYKYWHPFVGSLYSSDARIVTAYFHLERTDILNMDWADTIAVAGELYRPLELDYVANELDSLVKVKLLRVVAPFRLCSRIPYRFEKTGRYTWTLANGSVVTQTPRDCCELFGGVYDSVNSTCYGNTPLS